MRIKKITASNYSIALQLVKEELGEDALILSTRSIKPLNAGGMEATQVEITAAVEFDSPKTEPEVPVTSEVESAELPEKEDADLKSLIFSLLSRTDQAQSMGLKPHQFKAYSHLVENGLDKKLASKILQKALEQNAVSMGDSDQQPERVMNLMEKVLPCKGEIDLSQYGPKIVAFVGPTGVGKTTTVAKIAAEYTLRRNKKVVMVSLDTYRLGAVDQLQIYGDIMEVPVEVARGKDDLSQIVQKHKDKDLILIDTTGRSHQDKDYSRQLKEVFDTVGGVETHLVLSVTAQEQLFSATYNQFSSMGLDRVLFTKLDEGLIFGSLFNFTVRNRLPISYLTSGQQVPEDLEVARPERVISLIFN
jgi:flagellar biosynthesis protein FlhF